MKKIVLGLIAGLSLIVLASCNSLQRDVVMSTDSQVQTEDVLRIERKLIKADVELICKTIDSKSLYAECENILVDIHSSIEKVGMNKALLARLYALEGRVLLIQGKESKAKDFYKASRSSCKGDSQTIILGARLGIITNINEDLVAGSNENGLLILERGIQYYFHKKFSNSVAHFDKAFLMLPPYYGETYNVIKTTAWELKEVENITDDVKIQEMLLKNQVTLSEMLMITQETTDLFEPYTNGKKLSEKDLYKVLNNEGFFNPKSSGAAGSDPKLAIARNEIMTKILCARVLWNIYVSRQDEGFNGLMYSDFYVLNGFDSPVPDIEAKNPDFDAVLGCVETEMLNLEDGINFEPSVEPTGVQVNKWIHKVK